MNTHSLEYSIRKQGFFSFLKKGKKKEIKTRGETSATGGGKAKLNAKYTKVRRRQRSQRHLVNHEYQVDEKEFDFGWLSFQPKREASPIYTRALLFSSL
jgi:hypothetical protein